MLTPEQVSQRINVPTATLAVWRCTKRVVIPFVKIGRAVRYRPEDIDAFIAANIHDASAHQ